LSSEQITCSGLTKRFRNLTAVDGLDLEVSRGDVFGFLGPNGAGKSTTLRMMVGLIKPTSGSVSVLGHDVWREHVRAMTGVGAMIEAPAFYKYLSGRDNVRILANTGGRYSKKDIDEALTIVGLIDRARDKVKTYSQGMRQRLGIALAIVGRPDLVLLDEPTNGLDPQGMKEVRDLIRQLSTDHGMTVFLSSHLLHEVEQVCSRIAVINKGKMIASGAVKDLLVGRNVYRVSIDRADLACKLIEQLKWAKMIRADFGSMDVEMDGHDPSELNRAFVEGGVAVSGLTPIKASLEELYLDLMGTEN
jgi:ABC-2 type transport system ATP-binding protein